jgi:hypothetical protein
MTNLKTKILESVHKNNVTMIPKWRFMLHSSLGIFGLGFIFLIAVFFFSLVLFLLSRYGFMYLPFFGFMATMLALQAIPLVLLVCTTALLVLIEVMSRYYSFSFRRPLMVTLLALTSAAAGISFIISETPVHDYIRGYAEEHHMDGVLHMYDRPMPFRGEGAPDILRGEVVAASATSTILRLFDGVTVVAYASSTLMQPLVLPHVGDDVVVFGTIVGDDFEMVDVRPAPHTPFGGPMRVHDGHMKDGFGFHGKKMPMMNMGQEVK